MMQQETGKTKRKIRKKYLRESKTTLALLEICTTDMLLFYILPYLNLKEILSLKKISKELSKFVNYIPEEVIFPLAWNYIYKIMEEITCAGKK